MKGSFLGPAFSQEEIETRLRSADAHYQAMSESELLTVTAEALAAGKAVGWFQGRMEFGPRALGARSILADPRSPAMQSTLNLKVKRRESFRPFAPAVTLEAAPSWFDLPVESPYMLLVADASGPKYRQLLTSITPPASRQCARTRTRAFMPSCEHSRKEPAARCW